MRVKTKNGDMSAATVPTMTTHLSIGDDVAFLTMEREGKPGSLHLSLPNVIVGQQWPPPLVAAPSGAFRAPPLRFSLV